MLESPTNGRRRRGKVDVISHWSILISEQYLFLFFFRFVSVDPSRSFLYYVAAALIRFSFVSFLSLFTHTRFLFPFIVGSSTRYFSIFPFRVHLCELLCLDGADTSSHLPSRKRTKRRVDHITVSVAVASRWLYWLGCGTSPASSTGILHRCKFHVTSPIYLLTESCTVAAGYAGCTVCTWMSIDSIALSFACLRYTDHRGGWGFSKVEYYNY